MSTTIALSEPKSIPLRYRLVQQHILGISVTVWALALLLIAVAAHLDMPVITFGAQELVAPF